MLRLLFVDQVCSAGENVNVALIHEDGFLLQRRAGAGLVPTCEEQTCVKNSSQPTGRLQIIVGASGCGPTVHRHPSFVWFCWTLNVTSLTSPTQPASQRWWMVLTWVCRGDERIILHTSTLLLTAAGL